MTVLFQVVYKNIIILELKYSLLLESFENLKKLILL